MIGPEIPKELLEQKHSSQPDEGIQQNESSSPPSTSPQHSPPTEMAGPMIPTEMISQKRQQQKEQQSEDSEDDIDAFLPALPPDLLQVRQEQKPEQQPQQQQRRRRAPVGPSLPSNSHEVDDPSIGPVLPSNYDAQQDAVQSTIQAIEERAEISKKAMEQAKSGTEQKKVERGEWMLVPPEIDYLRGADSSRSRGFNQYSLKGSERDRSVWTDSPADRERKRKLQEGNVDPQTAGPTQQLPPVRSSRDNEVRQNIQKYNNTERTKSLVQIHQETAGRKRKEQEDVSNRPFDREKDFLKVSRPMDKKQRQEMLRKVGELGNRFGSGSSSFL